MESSSDVIAIKSYDAGLHDLPNRAWKRLAWQKLTATRAGEVVWKGGGEQKEAGCSRGRVEILIEVDAIAKTFPCSIWGRWRSDEGQSNTKRKTQNSLESLSSFVHQS